MKFIKALLLIMCSKLMVSLHACPYECECYYKMNMLCLDCSGKNLEQLPADIDEQVDMLDLSNNLFKDIPQEINSFPFLNSLNLSNNEIMKINANALINLTSLETLDLSQNKLSSWQDLSPNEVLLPAISLKVLILSKNPLQIFANMTKNNILISESLEILEMSNCGITIAEEKSPISGFRNLRKLILSHNPLQKFKLVSSTLEILDISHCQFSYFNKNSLIFLPNLSQLYISHNYRLDLSTKSSSLNSFSLTYIDISFCNIARISTSGIPNVEILSLKNNMIRKLSSGEFYNNSHLHHLDISQNAISTVHQNAFLGLVSLKILNLSVNLISDIHPKTFLNTPNITKLILSRNYIKSINGLMSNSLNEIDVSLCEIENIDSDALRNLPYLYILNLARNFVGNIYDGLKSFSIQQLDLSYNRVSDINYETFQYLPSLTILHMNGNRLTTTLREAYFLNNTKLLELYIDDNMWRCDCFDEEMKFFYNFVIKEPPKIWDSNSLTCHSPTNVSGLSWINACRELWYPQYYTTYNSKATNFIIALGTAFFICFVILCIVKRSLRVRMLAEQEERQRMAEEARERFRQMQMRREQEAQRNAPDPRDLISPPSYTEALLMPPLSRSLTNIPNQSKIKNKRERRRTRSSGDLLEEQSPTPAEERRRRKPRNQRRYKRSHSENNMTSQNEDTPVEQQTNAEEFHESNF